MGTWASYKALGRLADLIWSGQNPFCGEKENWLLPSHWIISTSDRLFPPSSLGPS